MLTLIATVMLAANPPLDWQFPGMSGPDLQAAVRAAAGPVPRGHLFDEAAREAHLAEVRWSDQLGCLADEAECSDSRRAVFAALQLAGQVVATARSDGSGHTVVLTLHGLESSEPQVYSGRGATLDEAAQAAYAALQGRVTLVLTLDPPDASIRLDGEPFGQGSGTYTVPPGDHDLTFEAPGRRTVKQPIRADAGDTLEIETRLPAAVGRLSLKVEPANATVFLDGAKWADPGTARELPPGPHGLRIEAEGYVTFTTEVTVKSGTVHDLSMKLHPEEPDWREALSRPHPDTGARPWAVRANLRLGSARDGEVGLALPNGGELSNQDNAIGMVGAGFSVGWRGEHLLVEGLGLSYAAGSARTDATFENQSTGDIDALSQLTLRPLWVGARYPFWRIEPYALAGVGFVWETFDVDRPSGAQQVSDTRFMLGTELGVRYAFDDALSAGVGAVFDFLPGSRASAAFVVQVGYALDLPEPWK